MKTALRTLGITIRCATGFDADAIAQLACDLGYPTDADTMRTRIRAVLASTVDSLFVAADSFDIPLGWLQAHSAHLVESGFRVEILGLVVSPAARRVGIGRTLVAEAERWARQIGARVVVVRSNILREESHAFYSALGYDGTKTQLVYRKTLSDAFSP